MNACKKVSSGIQWSLANKLTLALCSKGTHASRWSSSSLCSRLSSVSLSTGMQGAMARAMGPFTPSQRIELEHQALFCKYLAARARGPFTPSQWTELEDQALIYEYLAANSPVPDSLLIPIRRSLASSPYPPSYFGTSTYLEPSGNADLEPSGNAGLEPTGNALEPSGNADREPSGNALEPSGNADREPSGNALEPSGNADLEPSGNALEPSGNADLEPSGNADLEPGRCCRTDGKKWRCSRDAVADHKYCKRHVNRETHGSRKHVEGSGNADLEPGRCCRTDGKKWRCSRDAVADHKYCERHVNRETHGSRKHVEGQPGHATKDT